MNAPAALSTPAPVPGLALSRLLELTAEAVQGVRGGRSLNDMLPRVPAEARPAVQALSFHVLRWLGSASEVRARLAPKTPPPAVDGLLLTALALLWPVPDQARQPYPDHTLVDQAVAAVRVRAPAAAGFVNAVLRRFIRERALLAAAVRHVPLGAYNHPLWWVERVRQDWPAHWTALLEAANLHPPMTLRVNACRSTGSAYVQRLQAEGRAAQQLPAPALGGQAVVLAQPCAVHLLPGFVQGEVSVQDAAAQRAARLLLGVQPGAADTGGGLGDAALLPLPPGARVLDACAAPGGKTAHLLELAAAAQLTLDLLALDSDAQRLTRVHDTLQRLQLPTAGSTVRLQAADACATRTWWDGQPFDAILLDAPCTASGIVRRHPDVRWLRRAEDISALARTQAALLDALWPLLKPGGRLLYATCSLFKAEGQHQIDAFLQRSPAPAPRLDPASPGHLLPLADNLAEAGAPGQGAALQDGFFYALLHKPPA